MAKVDEYQAFLPFYGTRAKKHGLVKVTTHGETSLGEFERGNFGGSETKCPYTFWFVKSFSLVAGPIVPAPCPVPLLFLGRLCRGVWGDDPGIIASSLWPVTNG